MNTFRFCGALFASASLCNGSVPTLNHELKLVAVPATIPRRSGIELTISYDIAEAAGITFFSYIDTELAEDAPESAVQTIEDSGITGHMDIVVQRITMTDDSAVYGVGGEGTPPWTAEDFVFGAAFQKVPLWPEYTREGLISVYAVMYLDGKFVARSDTEWVIKCVR